VEPLVHLAPAEVRLPLGPAGRDGDLVDVDARGVGVLRGRGSDERDRRREGDQELLHGFSFLSRMCDHGCSRYMPLIFVIVSALLNFQPSSSMSFFTVIETSWSLL